MTMQREVFLTDSTSVFSSSGHVRARIDDLGAHANLLEHRRRAQRRLHHAAQRDERDVRAFALHVGDAERNHVVLVRNRTLHLLVADLVLEDDDRVVVANSGLEQALGVVRRRRHHDLQARNVTAPRMQRLRVLRRRPASRAHRRADDDGHLPLAAGHVVDLGGLVGHLVHDDASGSRRT